MRRLVLPLSLLFLAACGDSKQPQSGTATAPAVEKRVTPESALGNPSTQKLDNVLGTYYALKDAFVKSDSADVVEKAKGLDVAMTGFTAGLAGATPPAGVQASAEAVKAAATTLAGTKATATTLEQQRAVFETVSDRMTDLLKAARWKGGTYQQFCPMAFNDKGAHWLSNSDEIQNPYFGDRMLECGEVTDSL